jgi:glutathione S-transferase
MSDTPRLYFSPGACSRVPMILLEEAHAAYTLQRVSAQLGQTRSQAFLRLNPKGKVPVLVDGGQTITENVAIALHLAQRFADAALLPTPPQPRDLTEALSLLSWCASGLHPLIGRLRMPQRACDLPEAQARMRERPAVARALEREASAAQAA